MFDLICYILFDIFICCVVGLVWCGVERLKTNTFGGIVLIAGGVGFLIFGLVWYFSTMKKMKNK